MSKSAYELMFVMAIGALVATWAVSSVSSSMERIAEETAQQMQELH